jgi:MFS transporter, MHS family, proline/betaine transporter
MSQIAQQQLRKGIVKAVIVSSVGNVVEWIDWAVYGLAAPFIAAQFFPSNDPTTSLLQAFGVFAVGFMVRPIGAMVIGPMGDKYGRNKALAFSIFLMGGATGAIGLLPTYASIGIVAPLLLIFLSLLQGFALGGQWGAATTYLYELAPPHRRAFISSFRPCATGMGFFAGSALITLTTMVFSPEAMRSWGWRVPFLAAFLTGLIGLYIGLRLEDSPIFLKAKEQKKTSKQPLADMVKYDKKGMAVVFGFAMIFNSVFYVLYASMPSYLKTTLGIPYNTAMKITSLATVFYTIMIPVFGWVADKYSKKTLLTTSCLGFIFLSYPGFLLMRAGNYPIILGVSLFFSLLMAIFAATAPVIVAQQFPTRSRNTSVSVAFNLQASLFGGTAPLCITWLISALHDPIAPAYYMIAATIPAFVAVLYASYGPVEEQVQREEVLTGAAPR